MPFSIILESSLQKRKKNDIKGNKMLFILPRKYVSVKNLYHNYSLTLTRLRNTQFFCGRDLASLAPKSSKNWYSFASEVSQ